jgi:hypothetical protein
MENRICITNDGLKIDRKCHIKCGTSIANRTTWNYITDKITKSPFRMGRGSRDAKRGMERGCGAGRRGARRGTERKRGARREGGVGTPSEGLPPEGLTMRGRRERGT